VAFAAMATTKGNKCVCHTKGNSDSDYSMFASLLLPCSGTHYTKSKNTVLFVCLGFNGTFSTNRLYRAITVGKYIMQGQETTQILNT